MDPRAGDLKRGCVLWVFGRCMSLFITVRMCVRNVTKPMMTSKVFWTSLRGGAFERVWVEMTREAVGVPGLICWEPREPLNRVRHLTLLILRDAT